MPNENDIDLTAYEVSKKLIGEVKKHPILYDESMEGYKENDLKIEIWEKIAQEMIGVKSEMSVDMVKNRWRNLRWNCKKSFMAYKLRKEKGFKGKPFRFAREMAFLIPHYRGDRKNKHSYCPSKENWKEIVKDELDLDSVPIKNVNRIDVFRLIKAVKKYPILMDEKKRVASKPNTWKKVSNDICGKNDIETVQAVKIKWKNIRYRFLKAMEEYQYKISSGMVSNVMKPAYFDELSFLIQDFNKDELSQEEETHHDTDDDPLVQLQFDSTQDQFVNCKEESLDCEIETKIETAHVYSENNTPTDDIDGFFVMMGKMVKRMKTVNQILIKKTVMNIILDMELREARETGCTNEF